MGKTVIMVRHGRKDGKNIATQQIHEIEENGIPNLSDSIEEGSAVYLHPGSSLVRTRQTIKAWEKFAKRSGSFHPIKAPFMPDPNFGSDEIFLEMMKHYKHFKESGDMVQTLRSQNPEFLKSIQRGMLNSLSQIFRFLNKGEIMVMVSHSPMIEALASFIDPEIDTSALKELEGFIFNFENKKIEVKKT